MFMFPVCVYGGIVRYFSVLDFCFLYFNVKWNRAPISVDRKIFTQFVKVYAPVHPRAGCVFAPPRNSCFNITTRYLLTIKTLRKPNNNGQKVKYQAIYIYIYGRQADAEILGYLTDTDRQKVEYTVYGRHRQTAG